MTNDIIQFKAMPEKCLFNKEDYKIYGCYVNRNQYPHIKINSYGTATIKGDIQELNIGCEYIITAKEVKDKYGCSYEVTNIRSEKPTTLESSRKFLETILTYQQTTTLLNAYPDIVDRIIKNKTDDIDLNKTNGIKEKTFNTIKHKVIENFKLAELVDEFAGIFSISIIKKLYEQYTSIRKVRENLHANPYECLCGLGGIGFKTADELLIKIDKQSKENVAKGKKPILNFSSDLISSYQRMKACAMFVLDENEKNGNTYMSLKMFQKECLTMAKEASKHLAPVIKNCKEIYYDKQRLRIAKRATYETELYIAQRIKVGLQTKRVWNIDTDKYNIVGGCELSDEQKQTTKFVCNNSVTMLVGNAGSGKSFSTKALINMLQDNRKSFLLLAPTGRASKVLQGYTNCQASTIHRGLAFKPPNEWNFNAENQLREDIVIVDEFSMTDIFLFKHLLEAIDFSRTKLLLIGDDAQIPSVSCGNLLSDFLGSNSIPTVRLTKVFRYGIGGLSTVATDIRLGKNTFEEQKGIQVIGDDKGFTYIPLSQERAIDCIVSMYRKLINKGIALDDVLILSSQNVGSYGTQIINNKIQAAVNSVTSTSLKYGDVEYKVNDPVIQCVNNYNSIIYNEYNLD